MLRLDPGDRRIHAARHFDVWEGGGEYNVARGLRRCFGLRTAVVTALVDNAVGRLLEDLMLQGGVDLSLVKWLDDDGVGRTARNGSNFTERGFGPRGAVGCSDRGHTAASQMRPDDVDWEQVFAEKGVRWLHSGGIFAALGESTPAVVQRAFEVARRNGTRISYDLNYRESLWRTLGGKARARDVNRELVGSVDVLFGNEEDFSAALGFEVDETSGDYATLPTASYRRTIERIVGAYPQLRTVAVTLRTAKSASRNGWGALCYHGGEFWEVPPTEIEVFDRVGGGDSFASGFIYGIMSGREPLWALKCGVAHGALAMSTPGDTSMATRVEVERAMQGGTARIRR
jgi:2-dehydro-3-deoxygluconokinase